jgi:hypothetical protein
MHKQELNEDESKLICAFYLKEKEIYRFYREKLFEKVAKKAIK